MLKKLWNSLFSPRKALEKKYYRLLKEARDLQRAGDIPSFAKKTREAEDLYAEIQNLQE